MSWGPTAGPCLEPGSRAWFWFLIGPVFYVAWGIPAYLWAWGRWGGALQVSSQTLHLSSSSVHRSPALASAGRWGCSPPATSQARTPLGMLTVLTCALCPECPPPPAPWWPLQGEASAGPSPCTDWSRHYRSSGLCLYLSNGVTRQFLSQPPACSPTASHHLHKACRSLGGSFRLRCE